MKFLTKDDLFAKTDDGKFAMDGQIVGFVFDNKTYAAKLTISSKDVYLCQTRLNGGASCPDQKDMKFVWIVEPEQIPDYFIFQDDKIVKDLVELDKQVADFYQSAEKQMADFDKASSYIGADVIKESLESKRKTAEIALEAAQKAYEYMATPQGIDETCADLQKGATERYNKTIESWNKE